ncbi:MAG: fatty acyl-AMP ligase [Methylothermaceae bacterium]|nr:fatty acyl-AMP ligase [Methylothermaceae bacterium]
MRHLETVRSIDVVKAAVSNLVELLRVRAAETPERTAYRFLGNGENESGRLTFSDLDRRARVIAVRLQERGLAGERVLLLYPPGLPYIEAFLGCLYAGVVAVPAHPPTRQHLPRLLAVMRDAAPAAIMATEKFAVKFRDTFAGHAPHLAQAWLTTDTSVPDRADAWRAPPLSPESLAFLQYTSGSTGDPKGVMISHGNLLANQEIMRQSFDHTERATVVGWLPLYHDMGLIGNILQPLYVGSTAILMSPMAFLEKPVRWLKAISDYRAATSGGPNFAYDLCVRKIGAEDERDLDLSCWNLAFNGSEPVRPSTMQRFGEAFTECGFRRQTFFPCYGLAEATLFVAGSRVEDLGEGKAVDPDLPDYGAAPTGHAIRIVHPETGAPCADGRVGEIWVSGPSVAQGYWNRPEGSEPTRRIGTYLPCPPG